MYSGINMQTLARQTGLGLDLLTSGSGQAEVLPCTTRYGYHLRCWQLKP